MALYHPRYGYYNADKDRVGRLGDYYTSPAVHKIFGELIARQMEEMWRFMGEGAFTIVEMGANRGWLCHDIIECIRDEYPELYENLHYIIVETNPYAKEKQRLLLDVLGVPYENIPFCEGRVFDGRSSLMLQPQMGNKGDSNQKASPSSAQKESAKDFFPRGKVSWHTCTDDGFSFDKIQGCFLSNEFIDALPVHRFKVKNKILKEIYIGYNGKNFYEIDDEVSDPELIKYLTTNRVHLKEGLVYEVNSCAGEWLRHVSEKLNKGFVITIDYGDTTEGILQGNGSEGTVRCYYRHTVNREYYERPGEQDITAHVDFTNLMNAGRSWGLEVTGFVRQSHYLIALGILEKLNAMGNDVGTILKVKNLFHPEVMGEIFKVLIQHKNIENPQLISLRPLHALTMRSR